MTAAFDAAFPVDDSDDWLGRLDAARAGAFDSFSFGFGDEGMGLAAGVGAALQGGDFNRAFQAGVQRARANLAQARARHPLSTGVGQFAGAAAAFFPGAWVGRLAQLGSFGAPAANFLARGAGRGLGAWGRQALTAGGVGTAMGGLYGYGSAEGELAPFNVDTGEFSQRFRNVPMSALFGGVSSAAIGPAVNAFARVPAHSLARAIGWGRPAGAPRLRGFSINAMDRAMGAAGDDAAALGGRLRRWPRERIVDVADSPNAPQSYRAQYEAVGGRLQGGGAQAARLRERTGGRNLDLLRDLATHNYGGVAMNVGSRLSRPSRPLSSVDASENQALIDLMRARGGSAEANEMLRMLAAREAGRVSRAGPEAVGEGFANAAFFAEERTPSYNRYDAMSPEELRREFDRVFE